MLSMAALFGSRETASIPRYFEFDVVTGHQRLRSEGEKRQVMQSEQEIFPVRIAVIDSLLAI